MAKWSNEELKSYISQAESGDVKTQIYLGWAYIAGKLVDKDENLGFDWLRKAADLGSDEAAFRLAMILISRRQKDGIKIMSELASKGFAPASYELGNCHYTANLVDRNPEEAARQWSDAASKNHLLAKIKLLKYQRMNAILLEKPIYSARIFFALLRAIFVYIRNENDARVLGSFV